MCHTDAGTRKTGASAPQAPVLARTGLAIQTMCGIMGQETVWYIMFNKIMCRIVKSKASGREGSPVLAEDQRQSSVVQNEPDGVNSDGVVQGDTDQTLQAAIR